MKKSRFLTAALCVCITGCSASNQPTGDHSQTHSDTEGHSSTAHSEELHPTHGPHDGDLIELGEEDFHAEMVHGESGISIYILDAEAKQEVAIDADKLVISLKNDGAVKTFELAAPPSAEGSQSSQFISTDPELHQWLDAGAQGAVTVEIGGKSFTGNVAHDHDHEGHAH